MELAIWLVPILPYVLAQSENKQDYDSWRSNKYFTVTVYQE